MLQDGSDLQTAKARSSARAGCWVLLVLELAPRQAKPFSYRAACALAGYSLADHSDLSPTDA